MMKNKPGADVLPFAAFLIKHESRDLLVNAK